MCDLQSSSCSLCMNIQISCSYIFFQIEFNLVALNHQDKAARLSLIAPKILDKLKKFETDDPE